MLVGFVDAVETTASTFASRVIERRKLQKL